VTVTEPGGRRLNIAVFGQSKIEAKLIKSWTSRAYGQREPSIVAVFETRETGPQELTSLIVPAPAGQAITIDRSRVDIGPAQGFQILSGGIRDLILIGSQGGPAKCAELSGAFQIGWARFEDDVFARGFLIDGHRFETSDGFAFRSAAPISHCSFSRSDSTIKGAIDGVAAFNIGFGERFGKTTTNGTAYVVSNPLPVLLAEDGIWRLSDQTSEAIN
jgi:hypothetical protein